MIVIFRMSARSGDDSTELSHWVGRFVCELVIPGFRSWPFETQEYYAELIDFPVRKLAHMAEYAILGALVYADVLLCPRAATADAAATEIEKTAAAANPSRAERQLQGNLAAAANPAAAKPSRALLHPRETSVLFCILYAASDELHQLFVPGRSGQIRDVLLDSAGATLGVLGVCILTAIYRKLRRRTA